MRRIENIEKPLAEPAAPALFTVVEMKRDKRKQNAVLKPVVSETVREEHYHQRYKNDR